MAFAEIVKLPDAKQKEDQYNALFENIIASQDIPRAKEYLSHCKP